MQARGLDERSSWGQSMALFLAEGCSPKFGRGMVVPALTEGCSVRFGAVPGCQALQQPPAEGTSRQGSTGQSSLGSANAPAACALEVNPKQAKSRSIGKERRPHRSSLGEGFSTHQVVFCRPEPPCHPLSIPVFVWFLCCVCLCEPCDVFQMCLCALPAGLSALARDVSFPFPITFLFLWQGVLLETFHFPEAWCCGLSFFWFLFFGGFFCFPALADSGSQFLGGWLSLNSATFFWKRETGSTSPDITSDHAPFYTMLWICSPAIMP